MTANTHIHELKTLITRDLDERVAIACKVSQIVDVLWPEGVEPAPGEGIKEALTAIELRCTELVLTLDHQRSEIAAKEAESKATEVTAPEVRDTYEASIKRLQSRLDAANDFISKNMKVGQLAPSF